MPSFNPPDLEKTPLATVAKMAHRIAMEHNHMPALLQATRALSTVESLNQLLANSPDKIEPTTEGDQ